MNDLNAFDRRLFAWLSRRSDQLLAALPIAIFICVGVIGIVAISAIAHRSPDNYMNWVMAWLIVAAFALYFAAIYTIAAVFLRSRRFKLLELHQTMRDIQAMSWREFEDLVAAFYQAKGYEVEPRGGDLPDGGVDLIVGKGGSRWLVQCKHYRNQLVDVRALRELLGVVAARGVAGGILVACGAFDERALAFAKGNTKLELIGGEQLRELVADAVRTRRPGTTCPECGSALRETTGRYGPFLGCSNFPACHGWLPLPSAARPAPSSKS
ncbi:MAG TPA: restriction endonuclease [Candidatus Nitrosotalea sp.]|nr:restriction endonuclease [Candidatus Nitrosotalea sp.]